MNIKFTGRIVPVVSLIIVLAIAGCEQAYTPKPRGFQRIDFPEKAYKTFAPDCSFTADIPVYADAYPDSFKYAEKCWFNIQYLPFQATLHLSYKPIRSRNELFNLIEDSRTLVYKHTIKADEIYETLIGNKQLNGMLYNLSGNTATNFQFYVTDSTRHFLRGSLYFNVKTNNDSIEPVLAFLEQDIVHMIESLKWQNP